MIDYANNLIESKREGEKKQDFYSLEIGNYYISRLNYESAIIEFLLYLNICAGLAVLMNCKRNP